MPDTQTDREGMREQIVMLKVRFDPEEFGEDTTTPAHWAWHQLLDASPADVAVLAAGGVATGGNDLDVAIESFPKVQGVPLRLSFVPDAIREHFEDDSRITAATDDQLIAIAAQALVDDQLYRTFHEVLTRAATAVLDL